MADVCVLSVDGLPAHHLKLNEIHRIGKQAGLEICIADESMELAHGIVSLLRCGVVRLAAVAGRIFVNGEEKQIADIRKEDAASEGKVKLRFGNVEASLRFQEASDEAQDSSGFGECLKDRSVDTTDDSLCIPETQPPSANTTADTTADSFFIPETQAIVLERPSKSGKVSLGDDFMIPETENDPDPADLHQDTTTRDSIDSGSSGTGSHIRICTQDFNELNEDAIDDFDSSLMLDGALMALAPPKEKKKKKKQDTLLDASDLEMSALNWSASNSKCTVLNSTKADRAEACITPDLSAPPAAATSSNRDISTPDIFELMEAHEQEQATERSKATTPQLCGIKQLVVATIETPRTTQDEEDEEGRAKDQDMIETQAFPSRLAQSKESPGKLPNSDFIATQVFTGNGKISLTEQDTDEDQDFIATQAFPSRLPQEAPEKPNQDFIATQAFPSRLSAEQPNQDFIATQVFPGNGKDTDQNQDFIATQAFPSRLPAEKPNPDFIATQVFPSKSLSSSRTDQDLIETQPFQVLQAKAAGLGNKENIPQARTAGDSSLDELEEILKEMTSGKVVSSPPSSPNEYERKYVKPCVMKDKDHNRKVLLFENVLPTVKNERRWKNELAAEPTRCLKRVCSTDGQLPLATPSKRNRRLSEHSERLTDDNYSLNSSRKRPACLQEGDKSEPPIKSLCLASKVASIADKLEESTEDEAAAATAPKVTKRPTRRAKTQSRSPTPTVEIKQVKRAPRTRRNETKSKDAKSEENPPKPIRTRRQTKCLEPEEISLIKEEANESKQKPILTEPAKKEVADKAAPKRGITKSTKSGKKAPEKVKEEAKQPAAKKDPEEVKEEAKQPAAKKDPEKVKEETKQPAAKKDLKKPTDSAKKDSEETKNLSATKRRPGRQRKSSIPSSEDSVVQHVRATRNTRLNTRDDASVNSEETTASCASTNDSLPTNKGETKPEEKPKQSKFPVVRVQRTTGTEAPSTSAVAVVTKTVEKAVEAKNISGATRARLSQADHQDQLKAINKYLKQAKGNGKLKITFTMCNRQDLAGVIRALKHVMEVTEDPLECDLLVMDKGERTYKFLTAMAANKPVLSSQWLLSIKSTKTITVTDKHLFKDPSFEKVFKFNPLRVLEHPQLFKGLSFLLCEGIQPNANEMKAIIECAAGRVYTKPPPLLDSPHLYVVTTKKDTHTKRLLRAHENVLFIKTEGVMQSLVQHQVQLLDEHQLKL